LLHSIDDLAAEFFRKDPNKYVLLSSLSIADLPAKRIKMRGCEISSLKTRGKKFPLPNALDRLDKGCPLSKHIDLSEYRTNTIVSPIHRLTSAPWWQRRSPSIRLRRTIIDYKANLYQVLKHSNSIMFIDPHVDPSKPRYRSFIELVKEAGQRTPVPKIEVHRACYTGSGPSCRILNTPEIKEMFQGELLGSLTAVNLTIEVFIWDDFHDRYLISNLVGICMLNGFDTSSATNAMSTWTRLGRDDRDDVQREFDPASNRHVLRGSFILP